MAVITTKFSWNFLIFGLIWLLFSPTSIAYPQPTYGDEPQPPYFYERPISEQNAFKSRMAEQDDKNARERRSRAQGDLIKKYKKQVTTPSVPIEYSSGDGVRGTMLKSVTNLVQNFVTEKRKDDVKTALNTYEKSQKKVRETGKAKNKADQSTKTSNEVESWLRKSSTSD